MNNQYQNQLRRKVADAESRYKELGGLKAVENARRAIPIVKATITTIKRTIDGIAPDADNAELDLKRLEARLTLYQKRSREIKRMLTPPARKYHVTKVMIAKVDTRVLDFDSSDHAAHVYGGTITSRTATIDVFYKGQADRNPDYSPRTESIRSEVSDDTKHLQATLAWYRDQIANLLDSSSSAYWVASLPHRAIDRIFSSAVRA